MRVLLEECVPKRLRAELAGHQVVTVGEAGWSGMKNGQLLSRAAADSDGLLTVDKNLQFQQHLAALPISVVVLSAANNRRETLLAAMPKVRDALDTLRQGQLVVVRA
jgi:predicted nuclease of predicted toxin-antitoxin system